MFLERSVHSAVKAQIPDVPSMQVPSISMQVPSISMQVPSISMQVVPEKREGKEDVGF